MAYTAARRRGWAGRSLENLARARRLVAGLKLEALIVALLLATGAAVYYEDEILGQTSVHSAGDSSSYLDYSYSDQYSGGRSVVAPDPGHPLGWTCSLQPGHEFPYCGYGLTFDPNQDGRGLDLPRLDRVTLVFTYQGPARSLRMDLKNRDDFGGRLAADVAEKVNSTEFPIVAGIQQVDLSVSDFTVAAWWVAQNRIPAELSRPQFDNVTALEIQTGNGAQPGEHRIRIHSITFRGSLLSTQQWYAGLFGCWAIVLGLILIFRRRQARRQQQCEAARWRKTLDTIPQMVWSVSDDADEYYNGQWNEFAGTRPGTVDAASRTDLIHPDDRPAAIARWQRSVEAGTPFEAEYRMRHHSGDYRYVLSRAFPERDESGQVVRWYGTCTDIDDRVLAQQDLWRSQNFTRQLIEASPDGILVIDAGGNIVFANEAARAGLGVRSKVELTGKAWIQIVPPEIRRAAVDALALAGSEGSRHFTAERLSMEGPKSWWDVIVTPLAGANGAEHFLVISRDISHQKIAEDQARWSARHDSLTELPNRLVVQQELDALTASAAGFAVLILDLDEFKKINDTFGHDAGDALLCTFADRLRGAARPDDLVARLGGDEFAVLLKGVCKEDEVRAAAERIFASLRDPCVYQGKIIDCRTSIGASLFPRDGRSKAELLKNADVALYVAKSSGRKILKIFHPDMRADVELRHGMISKARKALEEDSIIPYYQPKIELATGRIAGFEALLRWRHPRRGIQAPDTIWAAFDDLTLAAEISDRMVDRVVSDVREWLDRGYRFDHVAFNAAAAELRAADFAERLLERLDEAAVPARCIQVEVTETVFLGRGAEYVEHTLKTLSENGIRIALDDFGTGYASLSHLKAFPVDLLKIDRSFVRHLQTTAEDGAIVDAVIGLGKSLRIDVIAEGIETRAQHDSLVALGCKYGQGFLYSRPMAATEVGRICAGDAKGRLAAAA